MANQVPHQQAQSTAITNGSQQSKAIVKGPQARLNTLKELFERSKGSISAVLPRHLTPERLIKIVTSAASRNPDLLDCTPESVLLAVVQAGTLGLEPNTPLHHCALVPYNNKHTNKKEAQLVPEYKGLCQLAYNSGMVDAIYAHEICEHDKWSVTLGDDKRLHHEPFLLGDRGNVIAFYAVVKMKGGGKDFAIMTKAEVDKIRASSPGANADAWVNHYVEMGKKTAIRRLSKTAPMSVDKNYAKALELADAADTGKPQDYSDVIEVIGVPADPETGEVFQSAPPQPSRTEAARERLEARAQ